MEHPVLYIFSPQLLSEVTESTTEKEEPLSNAYIWLQRRQQVQSDNSILSDNSQNLTPSHQHNGLYRSDSSSSSESFASAVSSVVDSVYSAEEGSWNYIEGEKPSKIDNQVYEAIKNCEIDTRKFPRIQHWKLMVKSTDEHERSRWLRKKQIGKLHQAIPRFSIDMDDE